MKLVRFTGLLALSSLLLSCQSDSFDDAVAVWNLRDMNDATAQNSVLVQDGSLELVSLSGTDASASRTRGGDGYAARFEAGKLVAGQGAASELNIDGKEISVLVRFKAERTDRYSILVAKDGTDQSVAYRIALNPVDGAVRIEATVGSDEIAGAHKLVYAIPSEEVNRWQDVVFMFDGHLSRLFVNGVLRDDEVTDGHVREWNTHPLVIGEGFTGMIDHVALWSRCISDSEVAELSGVSAVTQGLPDYYTEAYRPQFHFSAQKNWINDPNGLVWYDGVYHMFFQYMPPHRPGAYKDWGHATSTDLVHWTQTKEGQITPHKVWAGCWSGSAVIDENNVSGLQEGDEKVMIAYITNGGNPSAGLGPTNTQCIAYSTDAGRSFRYYDANPLIKTIYPCTRDPKVVWDSVHDIWVMSLYLDRGGNNDYALFTSKNLLDWERIEDYTLAGDWECPGFMPLPVDGADKGKWLAYGARGIYQIGTFDGKKFTPETAPVRMDHGRNFYAAQTWNNSPDGRCIHVAWMNYRRYPGMPFDEQMNFPTELTLRTTPDGIRVFRTPVKEIETLYADEQSFTDVDLTPDRNILSELSKDLYDMSFVMDARPGSSFEISARGARILYDASSRRISVTGPVIGGETADLGEASVRLTEGKLNLRILIDRTSVEVFGNDGETVITSNFMPAADDFSYSLSATGRVHVDSAVIHELNSSWVD